MSSAVATRVRSSVRKPASCSTFVSSNERADDHSADCLAKSFDLRLNNTVVCHDLPSA